MRTSNKIILGAIAVTAFGVAAVAMMARADAALTVSCSGAVSGNQITWTATSTGGVAPYAFLWSGSGIAGGATGTAVTVTYGVNGTSTAMIQVTDASSSVATSSCSATVSSYPPVVTPPPTPPLPRVYPPELTINANGRFLVHGMTVTSVASGSFQGTVWGITYTVNWSGNLFPEFYFREGNDGGTATNPVTQLQVGDEVGVSGVIASSSPLVVQADVVRDYSITTFRPGNREGQSISPFYNGTGEGGSNLSGTENESNASATTSTEDLNTRLQSLLSQFHNLQDMLQNRGNGNGNDNGNKNGNGNGQGDN